MLILIALAGLIPLAAVSGATIHQVVKLKRKSVPWKFQYHISDILVGLFSLGAIGLLLQQLDINLHREPIVAVYFTTFCCLGLLAGKFWQVTSTRKSLHFSALYMLAGAALWTLAAFGLAFSVLVVIFAGGGCC